MTKDEALKLALEALTYIYTETTADEDELIDKAITAIKEALAQEHAMHDLARLGQEIEQEPVAWMFEHSETGRMNYVSNDGMHTSELFLKTNLRYALVCPLYAAPPQRPWVGLTDNDWGWVADRKGTSLDTFQQGVVWAADILKGRNK
jgi:hypothetical protein